jgi:hypothetical protein
MASERVVKTSMLSVASAASVEAVQANIKAD